MLDRHFWMYADWEWGLEGKINKMGRGGLNVTDWILIAYKKLFLSDQVSL